MNEQKPYKERLKNLLNNIHSVRIHNSQDNSCIFIEKIQEVEGSDTESSDNSDSVDPSGNSSRYEELKDERGNLRFNNVSHPASSINEEHNSCKENFSLMIPKYK